MDVPAEPSAVSYQDDDLVYVDPETKTVIGKLEWSNSGRPKALPLAKLQEEKDDADKDKKKAPRKQRYYPWGTYRSMKHVYKIEGKQPKVESQQTLDEAIEKAIKEPFWD